MKDPTEEETDLQTEREILYFQQMSIEKRRSRLDGKDRAEEEEEEGLTAEQAVGSPTAVFDFVRPR